MLWWSLTIIQYMFWLLDVWYFLSVMMISVLLPWLSLPCAVDQKEWNSAKVVVDLSFAVAPYGFSCCCFGRPLSAVAQPFTAVNRVQTGRTNISFNSIALDCKAFLVQTLCLSRSAAISSVLNNGRRGNSESRRGGRRVFERGSRCETWSSGWIS